MTSHPRDRSKNSRGEQLKRLLLISPAPPGANGIATWVSIVIKELEALSETQISVVDTTARWRHCTDERVTRRLVGGSMQAIRDFIRSLRQMHLFRPDCIHLNTSAGFANAKDWLVLQAARSRRIRCVIQYHIGFLPTLAERQNLQWRWVKANMRLASKVLVLGQHSAVAVAGHLPSVDVESVPNPVCISEVPWKTAPHTSGLVHFLFLGHVKDGKGVFELISACAQMDQSRFRLSIVGPVLPSDRQRLLELAGSGANRWLYITGALTRQECLEKLANADVLVLPSKGLFEAFPYAVLEAMAASRPVISTARGAIQEMLDIDGRRPCGLLVKAGDVAELRTAMERIISNPLLGHELGRCGRQRVSELYDSRVVVKSLLKVWFPTRQ